MDKGKIQKIASIAKDVYKTLGSGHPEVVYDKTTQVGLRLAKIKYEKQIDQMVYGLLYGLEKEEIKIIKNSINN